jgi:outer membrane protein TolC
MKKLATFAALTIPCLCAWSLDFDQTARQLAAQSRSIQSLKLENKASIAELESENSLAPTDVEAGYMLGSGETINKWNISVSQSFDWPGAYAARRKGNAAAKNAFAAAERSAMLAATLDIKLAMIDVVAAKKYLRLSATLCDSLSALHAAAAKGVESGSVTRLDYNKIQIERIDANKQRAADQRTYNSAVAALESLCGSDVSEIVAQLNDYPEQTIQSEETYRTLLTEANPAIFQARQEEISAKAMTTVEKRLALPGFSIGYAYENEVSDRWHGITAGISLPIFTSRKKSKAAVARAQMAHNEALLVAARELASVTAERNNVVSLYDEIQQYRPIFDNDDNIMLLRKAVAGGEMNIFDYFGEVNYFIAARRSYLEVQYEYHTTLARLNRLTLLQD